jgi:hypothetical protein
VAAEHWLLEEPLDEPVLLNPSHRLSPEGARPVHGRRKRPRPRHKQRVLEVKVERGDGLAEATAEAASIAIVVLHHFHFKNTFNRSLQQPTSPFRKQRLARTGCFRISPSVYILRSQATIVSQGPLAKGRITHQ